MDSPTATEFVGTVTFTPAKPVTIHKNATAKEILAAINQWGTTGRYDDGREQRKLWNVLTGLRGPDNGDDDLKERTTAVIRFHVVPDLAKSAGAIVASGDIARLTSYNQSYDPFTATYRGVEGGHHFGNHIAFAAQAIVGA